MASSFRLDLLDFYLQVCDQKGLPPDAFVVTSLQDCVPDDPKFTSLELASPPTLGEEHLNIVISLLPRCTHLQSLSLIGLQSLSRATVDALRSAFGKTNTASVDSAALTHLTISSRSQITPAAAEGLRSLVESTPSLTHLDLTGGTLSSYPDIAAAVAAIIATRGGSRTRTHHGSSPVPSSDRGAAATVASPSVHVPAPASTPQAFVAAPERHSSVPTSALALVDVESGVPSNLMPPNEAVLELSALEERITNDAASLIGKLEKRKRQYEEHAEMALTLGAALEAATAGARPAGASTTRPHSATAITRPEDAKVVLNELILSTGEVHSVAHLTADVVVAHIERLAAWLRAGASPNARPSLPRVGDVGSSTSSSETSAMQNLTSTTVDVAGVGVNDATGGVARILQILSQTVELLEDADSNSQRSLSFADNSEMQSDFAAVEQYRDESLQYDRRALALVLQRLMVLEDALGGSSASSDELLLRAEEILQPLIGLKSTLELDRERLRAAMKGRAAQAEAVKDRFRSASDDYYDGLRRVDGQVSSLYDRLIQTAGQLVSTLADRRRLMDTMMNAHDDAVASLADMEQDTQILAAREKALQPIADAIETSDSYLQSLREYLNSARSVQQNAVANSKAELEKLMLSEQERHTRIYARHVSTLGMQLHTRESRASELARTLRSLQFGYSIVTNTLDPAVVYTDVTTQTIAQQLKALEKSLDQMKTFATEAHRSFEPTNLANVARGSPFYDGQAELQSYLLRKRQVVLELRKEYISTEKKRANDEMRVADPVDLVHMDGV